MIQSAHKHAHSYHSHLQVLNATNNSELDFLVGLHEYEG